MNEIKEQDWEMLPEQAQREVYNFFMFIKQRYSHHKSEASKESMETIAFSNHSADTISDWLDNKEDEVWK